MHAILHAALHPTICTKLSDCCLRRWTTVLWPHSFICTLYPISFQSHCKRSTWPEWKAETLQGESSPVCHFWRHENDTLKQTRTSVQKYSYLADGNLEILIEVVTSYTENDKMQRENVIEFPVGLTRIKDSMRYRCNKSEVQGLITHN